MGKKIFISIAIIFFGISIFWLSRKSNFVILSSSQTGITFENTIDETDSLNILINEYIYNGAGVAVADFNNDGKEDLYFSGNIVDNRLYLNQGDMNFKDVTESSNTACSGKWSTGLAVVDINGDGLKDIYVSVTGKVKDALRKNAFLINQGNNKEGVPIFVDKAEEFGVADAGYSIQAFFFDYDKDSYLDLYVINNHFTNRGDVLSKRHIKSNSLIKNRNILYKNINGERFEDVTNQANVLNDAFSLGAVILDINDDGWLDIFVSNDFVTSSTLFVNQKDGTFKNEIGKYFKHQSLSSMGVDASDFNNDGDIDIITVDMLPIELSRTKRMFSKSNFLFYDLLKSNQEEPQYMRNSLYVNDSYEFYNEISQFSKVHSTDWSWAPLFADFDNDGQKDLYITNGFPRDLTDLDYINYRDSYQSILDSWDKLLAKVPQIKLPNVMFQNKGEYEFSDVTAEWGLDVDTYSYGLATGDLDQDGDLDIVVNNINDKSFVIENKLPKKNYLSVEIQGSSNNTLGLHTQLELYYSDSLKQSVIVNPFRGYMSSNSLISHFGLEENEKIDSLKIYWPSGRKIILEDVLSNQKLSISEESAVKKDSNKKKETTLTEVSDSLGIDCKHTDNKSYDFYAFELFQKVYTNEGAPIEVADINNDGLEDLVAGQGRGAVSEVFIQTETGMFVKKRIIGEISEKEVTSLALLDVDNDKDLDIYLGYGHNSSEDTTSWQDEVALNDGNGNFTIHREVLPKLETFSSKILVDDINGDGWEDLMVFSRVDVFNYPESPVSHVLINDKGKFKDKTELYFPNGGALGMISDAEQLDLNGDGKLDIIYTGEWLGMEVMIRESEKFVKNEHFFPKNIHGWWNSLTTIDIDEDGDLDLLSGNSGLNYPFRINESHPMLMLSGDYNDIEKNTPLIFVHTEGAYYPIHLRDNLLNQINSKKKDFPNYTSYSTAKLEDVLTEEQRMASKRKVLNTMESSLFINEGGKYRRVKLPNEFQFSSIFDFYLTDIDADGKKEILSVGNDAAVEVFTGPRNGMNGIVATPSGKETFKFWSSAESGFRVSGNGKQIKSIRVGGEKFIVVSQHSGKLKIFKTPS